MSKITQQAKIFAYCQEHGSITVREAFTKLNINSPCKRISEMRHSGKYIVTSTEEAKIEEGKVVNRWLRYFIKEKDTSTDKSTEPNKSTDKSIDWFL